MTAAFNLEAWSWHNRYVVHTGQKTLPHCFTAPTGNNTEADREIVTSEEEDEEEGFLEVGDDQ